MKAKISNIVRSVTKQFGTSSTNSVISAILITYHQLSYCYTRVHSYCTICKLFINTRNIFCLLGILAWTLNPLLFQISVNVELGTEFALLETNALIPFLSFSTPHDVTCFTISCICCCNTFHDAMHTLVLSNQSSSALAYRKL